MDCFLTGVGCAPAVPAIVANVSNSAIGMDDARAVRRAKRQSNGASPHPAGPVVDPKCLPGWLTENRIVRFRFGKKSTSRKMRLSNDTEKAKLTPKTLLTTQAFSFRLIDGGGMRGECALGANAFGKRCLPVRDLDLPRPRAAKTKNSRFSLSNTLLEQNSAKRGTLFFPESFSCSELFSAFDCRLDTRIVGLIRAWFGRKARKNLAEEITGRNKRGIQVA